MENQEIQFSHQERIARRANVVIRSKLAQTSTFCDRIQPVTQIDRPRIERGQLCSILPRLINFWSKITQFMLAFKSWSLTLYICIGKIYDVQTLRSWLIGLEILDFGISLVPISFPFPLIIIFYKPARFLPSSIKPWTTPNSFEVKFFIRTKKLSRKSGTLVNLNHGISLLTIM